MLWHDLKAAFSLSVSLFVYLLLQHRWLRWCPGPLDIFVFRFGFPFFIASILVWVVVSLRSLWLPLWVLLYIFVSLGGFDVGFRLIFPCPLSQSASFAFVSRSRWWCQCLQSIFSILLGWSCVPLPVGGLELMLSSICVPKYLSDCLDSGWVACFAACCLPLRVFVIGWHELSILGLLFGLYAGVLFICFSFLFWRKEIVWRCVSLYFGPKISK